MVYRAEKADCRRFPTPASGDLAGGPRRNFQVFDALDFLAELTQHIPDKGEHLVRYYGWYSYRRRGMRAKDAPDEEGRIDRRLVGEGRSAAKGQSGGTGSSWAALVKRVFEVDPLACPKCGNKHHLRKCCGKCRHFSSSGSFVQIVRFSRPFSERGDQSCPGPWPSPLKLIQSS